LAAGLSTHALIASLVQPADTAMRIVVNAVALIGNVCGAARPLAAGAVAFVPLLPWSLALRSLASCSPLRDAG
jgi:hypothetical protein